MLSFWGTQSKCCNNHSQFPYMIVEQSEILKRKLLWSSLPEPLAGFANYLRGQRNCLCLRLWAFIKILHLNSGITGYASDVMQRVHKDNSPSAWKVHRLLRLPTQYITTSIDFLSEVHNLNNISVRDVSSCCLTRPNDFHNLTTFKPIVSCNWVSYLHPRKLKQDEHAIRAGMQ